uniref:Immunoglobulin domain-containing protein n=1 Tax=Oreochromis aureus TaxID=47969 RepID=A0AAZ1XWL4_OREAU
MPPGRGFPGMSHWEEAPGQTQDTLKRLHLSAGLGTPWFSFTCEGFNISAGWKVRSTQQILSKCSNITVTKTCGIKHAFASDSGKYWCESGAERTGAVILESPVHPVVEGDAVILHCRKKADKQDSNFTADFYKDSFLMGTSYDGKLEIQKVSKSHEGFYKCNIHGVGESPESWLAHQCAVYTVKGIQNSRESPGSSLTLAHFFLPTLTHVHTAGRSQVRGGKSVAEEKGSHKLITNHKSQITRHRFTGAVRNTNVCSTIIQRREDLCSSLK